MSTEKDCDTCKHNFCECCDNPKCRICYDCNKEYNKWEKITYE